MEKKPEEVNNEINKYLLEEKKRIQNEFKLLLLGCGDSGKSTFAKQMKIIHSSGFSEKELLQFKLLIHSNIIESIQILISSAERFNIPLQHQESVSLIKSFNRSQLINPLVGNAIKNIYNDEGIQLVLDRKNEFLFFESTPYFLDCIDRIVSENYVPNPQDILRCRTKTTGIVETEFSIGTNIIRLVDVGGQRNQRNKWIHLFEGVTAVIFCSSLSEYDQFLEEDFSTNRMVESLRVFEEVCNNRWFKNTAIILFLNKRDIFEEKIKKIDLNPVCFSNYTGGLIFENASNFIKNQFLAKNRNKEKPIYCHITTAIDTQNITVVFNAVKDIVLRKMVEDSGLDI